MTMPERAAGTTPKRPYFRQDIMDEALKRLVGFAPTTTKEQGDLIDRSKYEVWKSVVQKQENDWDRIEKMLRPLKLGVKELGYIWYWCSVEYNWRGWATPAGLEMKMAANEIRRRA
jgi:hypothetical protein